MVRGGGCSQCKSSRKALEREQERRARVEDELTALRERVAELEVERERLALELAESVKLCELQAADLDRYKAAYESVRPNHPERVPREQLQLAFEQVVATLGAPANDINDVIDNASSEDESAPTDREDGDKQPREKRRGGHGRRNLHNLDELETKQLELIPPEVLAANFEGYEQIGEEISSRIAFRPAAYMRLVIRRLKFVRVENNKAGESSTVDTQSSTTAAPGPEASDVCPIVTAPLPASLWPGVMADPSAIAQVIVSKYDDILPLHRQERISRRDGFPLPRSTQCGWLSRAHQVSYRIVDAMFAESKAKAFCIATDATGAPVKAAGGKEQWDVFVFLADRDHITFRYVEGHATSASIAHLLDGFRGRLLADAAPIYDALYAGGMTEHCCWYHCRRYFYRAIETDRERALEPLSIIAKLFQVASECRAIQDPYAHTHTRAARAGPLLEMLDQWVKLHRDQVDPRGPLAKAIGYYDNQRDALHRFVEDSRISLHNNLSEQQLRNLALGRHSWNYFANETGLRWYTTFRSLIASCYLHKLDPRTYLEEVLRLAPHWPVTRVIELAPKYWARTRDSLAPQQRSILVRPWEAPTQHEVSAASESSLARGA